MELNLPKFDIRLEKDAEGRVKIYDNLRRKYVVLTPEEWVRQHFVNFLCENRGYPPGLMANEVSIDSNGTRRRSDTVVYDKAATPIAIIEYKAPTVEITPMVFDQIVRYNMVLNVKHLMVSNGLKHYCCRRNQDGTYIFLRDIPRYEELT